MQLLYDPQDVGSNASVKCFVRPVTHRYSAILMAAWKLLLVLQGLSVQIQCHLVLSLRIDIHYMHMMPILSLLVANDIGDRLHMPVEYCPFAVSQTIAGRSYKYSLSGLRQEESEYAISPQLVLILEWCFGSTPAGGFTEPGKVSR